MSPRVTLNSLLLKVRELETLDRWTLEYVVRRWRQGRHLELSLDRAEPLLIRVGLIRELISNAYREIESLLKSPYGGVEIYSIGSLRRDYGTGKSQVAFFVSEELNRSGFHSEYLSVDVETVRSGEFREDLWEVGRSREVQAVFVDEIDTLVSPDLSEEEQAKVIESFANTVIGYSERMSRRREFKQALVLILSFKAEEEVERVAQSRLGRRLMNRLITVDIPLTRSDIYEIFRITSALAGLYHGLTIEDERMQVLPEFASDFAEHLWSDRELARLSVGTILSKAFDLAMEFSKALTRANLSEVRRILVSAPERGTRAEKSFRRTLLKILPGFDFKVELGGAEHGVNCSIDGAPVKVVGNIEADVRYLVSVGLTKVGYCFVEITAEKKMSSRKKEQLKTLGGVGPLIVVHLYPSAESALEFREDVNSVGSEHPIVVMDLPLVLFKYPAALDVEGDDLCFSLSKTLGVPDAVRALLHKISAPLAYKWLASELMKEIRSTLTREEMKERIREALRGYVRSALGSIDMSSATRRSLERIRRHFEAALAEAFPSLDEAAIAQAVSDVIASWEARGLGRKTRWYFVKSESWDDKLAEEVAVSALLPFARVPPNS